MEFFTNKDGTPFDFLIDTKICRVCGEEKCITEFRVRREGKSERVLSECKSCERKTGKIATLAKQTAYSKPESCECCKKNTTRLVADHCHISGNFRGWLCINCNVGIGRLGDTLQDLELAVKYLERVKKTKTNKNFREGLW